MLSIRGKNQEVCLPLYHSDQFVADQRSTCRQKKLQRTTCTSQRSSWQAHKGEDTWSRKKRLGPLHWSLTSLRVLPQWIGLQPNLGRVGGTERDNHKDQPAMELLRLCQAGRIREMHRSYSLQYLRFGHLLIKTELFCLLSKKWQSSASATQYAVYFR